MCLSPRDVVGSKVITVRIAMTVIISGRYASFFLCVYIALYMYAYIHPHLQIPLGLIDSRAIWPPSNWKTIERRESEGIVKASKKNKGSHRDTGWW